jgi:hypothetical protein
MSRLLVLGICASFATGCQLYWSGDDVKNDDCVDVAAPSGAPQQAYRDPATGTCEYFGGGGGNCGCNQPCGGDALWIPNWGQCYSACDGLDETTCMTTAGCHAAYDDNPVADQSSYTFLGCWATASPNTPTTPCANLDAQGCSEHDTCSMVYSGDKFLECIDETQHGCGVDIGCAPGSHCEQQCAPCNDLACTNTCNPTCVPDTTCAQIDCGSGYQCVEECDALVGPCTPTCVPTGHDPGQCSGAISCNSAPPVCPTNTTAGIANGCWTGYCIPNADCSPHDPGQCYAAVTCTAAAPSCPMGTLPGVINGCYSGYCIPTYSCEVPACETLSTEVACTARGDCAAVYTGSDCTCTMSGGCTCATETYAKCESLLMPL